MEWNLCKLCFSFVNEDQMLGPVIDYCRFYWIEFVSELNRINIQGLLLKVGNFEDRCRFFKNLRHVKNSYEITVEKVKTFILYHSEINDFANQSWEVWISWHVIERSNNVLYEFLLVYEELDILVPLGECHEGATRNSISSLISV